MRKKVSVNNYHSSLKKRFLDIFLSCTNIIIFSPVFVICSLLIKLTSKGPVLFIQKRVGKNGKILNLIKFRTMKVGSEKVLNKYRKLHTQFSIHKLKELLVSFKICERQLNKANEDYNF